MTASTATSAVVRSNNGNAAALTPGIGCPSSNVGEDRAIGRRLSPTAENPSSVAAPALCRQIPEAGAGCLSWARPDLSGGAQQWASLPQSSLSPSPANDNRYKAALDAFFCLTGVARSVPTDVLSSNVDDKVLLMRDADDCGLQLPEAGAPCRR